MCHLFNYDTFFKQNILQKEHVAVTLVCIIAVHWKYDITSEKKLLPGKFRGSLFCLKVGPNNRTYHYPYVF